MNSQLFIPALLALLTASAFAQKKWEAMEYGPFLSATIFNSLESDYKKVTPAQTTAKGIAIKLDREGTATMVFDTDLLRMSSGWTGGFLKYSGVIFEGGHGPNPCMAPNTTQIFATNTGPGWSKGGTWTDPRKLPTGPGAATVPYGPLPKDWAKYRSLSVHGDKVVLAYTVGAADVLESPALEKLGEQTVLTRTFNVTGKGEATSALLAEGLEGSTGKLENGVAVIHDPKNAESRAAVAIVGAPEGAALQVIAPARVVLNLQALNGNEAFKVLYWKGPAGDLGKFTEAAKTSAKAADLRELTKGGPARYPELIATQGVTAEAAAGKKLNEEISTTSDPAKKTELEQKLAAEIARVGKQAYVVDTITLPDDNPWKSWLRIGGLDFFNDGRAAISTWSGDVWIVSGLDDTLGKLEWKRFATGLFQPLGLKIADEKIHTLGRDQITRLTDLNNDGEADLYENFNNDVQVTPGFHEFALDLHTDPEGNFYFAKGGPVNPGGRGWGPLSEHNGCIFKIAKDGSKLEVFATGVRAPNGMGVGPKGEVTVGDNQGTWVPACYIHLVKPGGFVSVVDLAHRDPLPTSFDPHICFLPMDMDNSGGAQVWVTGDRWGAPLQGRLLHLSYGKATLLGTLVEDVGGTLQGGAFQFPIKFDTGIMRARFNPKDGQLYVAGMRGWQTSGAKDGAFQRVRYTGQPVHQPNELHFTDKGIHIGFTSLLDSTAASDLQNYSVEQWNYRWTKDYGSDNYKVSNPSAKGKDLLEVKSVRLSPDRKRVFLEVPGLQPVMQIRVKLNIKAEGGADLPKQIDGTINVVGSDAQLAPNFVSAGR